jgi:hypothetical protein
MTQTDALKLALEALEMADELCKGHGVDFKEYGLEFDRDIQVKYKDAIKALEEALASEQERNFCERCGKRAFDGIHTCTPPAKQGFVQAVIDASRIAMNESFEANDGEGSVSIPSDLAASLSLCLDEYDQAAEGEDTRRAWVGLTDRERQDIMIAHYASSSVLAQAIESKLKKKNKNA